MLEKDSYGYSYGCAAAAKLPAIPMAITMAIPTGSSQFRYRFNLPLRTASPPLVSDLQSNRELVAACLINAQLWYNTISQLCVARHAATGSRLVWRSGTRGRDAVRRSELCLSPNG